MLHYCLLSFVIHLVVSSLALITFIMVEATYENSPEYFKKFQKRFKYTICENEPKLENSAVENYAYGYHSSSASVDSCTSGSNHYHVIYEIGPR